MANDMRQHMKERFGKSENDLSYHPPLPNSLNIELNNTCNHKCEFCAYHGKYKTWNSTPSVLKVEFVKNVLEEAKKNGIGEKEVGFYLSGEVFLYSHLAEVISYAKSLDFKYTFITTNGALATPVKMKEVLDAGLDSVRFSVNAADREMYRMLHGTDDFDTVVNNITFANRYIKENKLNVSTSISCVVTKKQGVDLQERMRQLFADKVDDILFIPVILNHLSDMEKAGEEFSLHSVEFACDTSFVCPILFNTMYINSDGHVIPCCEAPYTDYYVYDLNEKMDLKEAWYSEGYQKLRSIFIEHEDDNGTICEGCILRCKGLSAVGL